MAGKEEPVPFSSPLLKPRMEDSPDSKICWRKQVDENLKRLHSLQFGADLALEKRDFSRLICFLFAFSASSTRILFLMPMRLSLGLYAVTQSPSSTRFADPSLLNLIAEHLSKQVELLGRKGDIDIEKIKQSKYFGALLQKYNIKLSNKLQESSCSASKVMPQANLASLYGNNTSKVNNGFHKSLLNPKSNISEDHMIIEKPYSHNNHPKGYSLSNFIKLQEEERGNGNAVGSKRSHVEISSPRNDNANSPTNNEENNTDGSGNGFVTARAKLEMDAKQKRGLAGSPSTSVSPQSDSTSRGYGARSYGFSRRGVRGNFIPPIKSNGGNTGNVTSRVAGKSDDASDDSTKRCLELLCGPDGELPEKLRNLEPRLIEHITGLDHAKKCVTEMVIWPLLRPDIFKGCRSPGRGLLLFGPPGTGKTMIGKAIAGEAKATFFYISASSLTSKWIGEGEKLVRALFGVASCRQPAVIFVDEIDSLLSQFLIEMEGFDTGSEQILLIGATNRPQELDEAARRRLTKRLYIPLPSSEARAWIVHNLLEKDGLFKLSNDEIDTVCSWTEVKDASMGPLREALKQGIEITKLKKEDMRPVTLKDFENAMQEVRPSVSPNELGTYDEWNKQFGSLSL
uniref:AAA+ ATPase domain-containing protein n=1 Tax=Salix viminalis TaxID=40686 RepID=A0A6N2K9W3_SALVM